MVSTKSARESEFLFRLAALQFRIVSDRMHRLEETLRTGEPLALVF